MKNTPAMPPSLFSLTTALKRLPQNFQPGGVARYPDAQAHAADSACRDLQVRAATDQNSGETPLLLCSQDTAGKLSVVATIDHHQRRQRGLLHAFVVELKLEIGHHHVFQQQAAGGPHLEHGRAVVSHHPRAQSFTMQCRRWIFRFAAAQ